MEIMTLTRIALLEDRLAALAKHARTVSEKLDAGRQPNLGDLELLRIYVKLAENLLCPATTKQS